MLIFYKNVLMFVTNSHCSDFSNRILEPTIKCIVCISLSIKISFMQIYEKLQNNISNGQ